MRTALAGAVLAASAIALGCNPQLLTPNQTIGGRLILDQSDPVERGGGECRGTGGYADLRSGVPVVIRDTEGAELSRGSLLAQPPPTAADGSVPTAERRRCVWSFSLPDVPERPAYEVEVGQRGAVTYTREELEAAGWNLDVALGVG